MNLAELTEQIRAIRDRMTREGHGRQADPGPAPDVSKALDMAAEELQVAREELRRQDEALRASQWALDEERRRYQDLFEHAPDAYLVTDAQGVIREANQRAVGLFNLRRRFLIGKPLVLFVVEEARPAFRSELHRLAMAPGVGRYELRMGPRHEPAFDAEVTAVAAFADGGRSIAVRWAVRDVTGRRQIEDRLRRMNQDLERLVRERTAQLTEEFLDRERLLIRAHAASDLPVPQLLDLVDGLDAIIWAADAATGRFTFVSRGAEAILGYPASAWIDDPRFWTDHLHADDRNWVIEHRERGLRQGHGHESEYRLAAADGRFLWFREVVRVVRDPEGRPREHRGLLVNISRRKKVERQLYFHRNELSEQLEDMAHLQAMSERLSATLELQPILEEILTGAMSVQGALKGLVRLHDRERGELAVAAATGLPAPCLEFIARKPVGVGACGVAFATGQTVVIEDTQGKGVDPFDQTAARLGEYRASFSIPLRNRAGRLLGTIATFFDEPHHPPRRQIRLVELFAAQAADFIENASLYRQAREAARSREVFLNVLAHELRHPLGAIHAAVQLLDPPDRGGGAAADARALIEGQLGRLDHLIGDLLDASRIAEGKLALSREPTDLRQVLGRAIESTRPERQQLGQTLREAIAGEPLRAEVDPDRIEQVFVNLLTKISRHTPPGGRIEVAADCEGEEIVVRVRGDGMGIMPEALARIMDMFAQDPASPATLEDLGIGLWLVRHLVEMHGGRVEVSSVCAGSGGEFLVTLPALPRPPEAQGDGEGEGAGGPRFEGPAPPVETPEPDPKPAPEVDGPPLRPRCSPGGSAN